MKATIDIPDELYRQVKAKSALRGQTVREVAVKLFQGWIVETDDTQPVPPACADLPLPSWFGACRKYAQKVPSHDMATIRRSIAEGRACKQATESQEKECK